MPQQTPAAVVIKLHGAVLPPQLWLVRSYAAKLPAQHLFIAYHSSGGGQQHEQAISAFSQLRAQTGVTTITYTTRDIETRFSRFFRKAALRAEEIGWKAYYVPNKYPDWPNMHTMILPAVLEWWRQTQNQAPLTAQYSHVWVVEGDALFVGGDVPAFFESFRDDGRDLLSTGFHLAGPAWWAYPLHTYGDGLVTIQRRQLSHFRLQLHGPQQPHGRRAPAAWSQDWAARDRGLLFRLTAVERYSTRLLRFAETMLLERGDGMHSEVFASTLCANASDWCSIGDWSTTGAFRSRFYFPFRGMDSADAQYADWCHDVCKRSCCSNQWVHPAMILKSYPRPADADSPSSIASGRGRSGYRGLSQHMRRVFAGHARLWRLFEVTRWSGAANNSQELCRGCNLGASAPL